MTRIMGEGFRASAEGREWEADINQAGGDTRQSSCWYIEYLERRLADCEDTIREALDRDEARAPYHARKANLVGYFARWGYKE